MYIRAVHAERDIRVLRKLIHDNPLGLLTTAIRSPTFPFLQTSHIPFVLDVKDESSETECGLLRGHLARQNPHSKAMIEALTSTPGSNNFLEEEVLVLFNAPAHHYVTPKFYTETKPATGKVVPTWNYAAAQVYGKAKIFFDSSSEETSNFLQKQIKDLSHHNETMIMGYTGEAGRPSEWKVSDAPDRFIQLLKKNIIGIEIEIDRLEGKFKMSQEMGKADQEGVIEGFAKLDSDAAQWVSNTVKARGELKGS
ncbi:transcriptional regulator PAI 2-type [Truncatella angustata]|uniref:Transcriptional regulator PAI 2-type n=1 Tax=Truncatella angustata TaxID=152316 RepID=A0A9P8ZWR3_9PEZI|nr:transcriptional regulator PAI 2-type [Truncatella angustata]KAH6652367.1 transcriptional regulator PAI 2-type [Truncatella angustata]